MRKSDELMRAKVRIEYQRWIGLGLPKSAQRLRNDYPQYLEGLLGNEEAILAAHKKGVRYEDQQAGSERF